MEDVQDEIFILENKEDFMGLIQINKVIVICIPNVHKTNRNIYLQDIELIVSRRGDVFRFKYSKDTICDRVENS